MKQLLRSIAAWLVSKLPRGILTDGQFFELYQSKGWHATPVHFYQPVPDTTELSSKLWEEPSELVGVDVNMEKQLELLEEFSARYIPEYHSIPETPPRSASEYTRARGFRGVDGAILYSMIRKFTPRRIIEIGSGHSTLLSILALRKNAEEHRTECGSLTAIEPYPRDFLEESLENVGELRQERVENVALSEFERLDKDDILFIDSSHTVKIGGDVVYEVLEILPRLKIGVLVHFHDIFLPLQYPKEWVLKKHTFWTEQYLLQSFLAFNTCFEILWSGGCMHAYRPDSLSAHFPYYDRSKQQSGSFWLRRCK